MGGFSHVKAWSRVLRSEGVTPRQKDVDTAEASARAAFGACVTAINAVDSLSYRFAEVRREGVRGMYRYSLRLPGAKNEWHEVSISAAFQASLTYG